MDELSVKNSKLDPVMLPEREPPSQPMPQRNPNAVRAYAQAVSIALGKPDMEAEVAAAYETTGKSEAWETSLDRWMSAETESQRSRIAENLADQMSREGIDVDAAIASQTPEAIAALERARISLTIRATSPEATAASQQMISDMSQEERLGMNMDGALLQHNKEKYDVLAETLQMVQEFSAEGIPEDTVVGQKASLLAGLAEAFVPLKYGVVMQQIMQPLVEKYAEENPPGTPLEKASAWLRNNIATRNPLQAGESLNAGLEVFVKLPPEEQKLFLRDLINLAKDSPLVATDFAVQSLVNEFIDPKVLYGNDPQARGAMWRIIDNIVPLIEIVGLGAIARGSRAARTAGAFSDIPIPDNGIRHNYGMDPMRRLQGQVSPEARSADLAEVFTYPTARAAQQNTGMTPTQVGRTQMPGFARTPRNANDVGIIEDIPDALIDEAARIKQLRTEITNISDNMRAAGMTKRLRELANKNQRQILEDLHGSLLRPGLTRMRPHQNHGGVSYDVVLGTSPTRGFSTKGQALEEALRLTDMNIDGIKIFASIGGRFRTPHGYTKDLLKNHVKAIKEKKLWDEPGNWYVGYTKDYYYRPEDRILFGKPVVGEGYLGTLGRWIETPSAQFSKPVYELFGEVDLAEAALISKLNQIVAPYLKLPRPVQRKVDDMFEWTNKHYKNTGKAPTKEDLQAAFPDATPEMYRGYYLMKERYDTAYDITNSRVYKDQHGRGFKTLQNVETGQQYNGKLEQPTDLAKDFHNGKISAWDPAKNSITTMSVDELNTLYKHGGRIIRMDLEVPVGEGKEFYSLVIKDPLHLEWELKPLTRWPLKYEEGYYPRLYEEPHFIYEYVQDATINGKPVTERTFVGNEEIRGKRVAIAVVGTARDAERYIKRLEKSNPDKVYKVGNDARLSTKDRVARDLEFLQLEGRLFFDNRQGRLKNYHGNDADIVSPTNMLARSAMMLSRQIATEDIVKSLKLDWDGRYGVKLLGSRDMTTLTSSAVKAELKKIIDSGSLPDRKLAIEAHEMWDYIDLIEGNVDAESQLFRRQSVRAAEFMTEVLTGGNPTGYSGTNWLLRNAHKVAPVQTMKSLAFFDFIVTRPWRQLVLQSSQQMFIAALDPAYIGQWQMDQYALLGGLKAHNAMLSGAKTLSTTLLKRNAKLMGLSLSDYKIVLKELDESGLIQAVNKHALAGDLIKDISLPASKAGDVAQTVGRTATAAPVREALERSGFTLGEQINVVASFLMALRLWRKANKGRTIRSMTRDDWVEVKAQADGFALSMHRSNSAKFQYGKLSLATQFLSFTHKVLLTFIRATPYSKELNIGNQAFTPWQARRLLGGQLILFGLGSGLGLKPEVQGWLEESGIGKDWDPELRAEVLDIMAGGSLDWILDKTIQNIFSTDLDIAFDSVLAPGANVINVGREFTKFILEQPILALPFGAFGSSVSRFYTNWQMASAVVSLDNDIDTWERWSKAANYVASGLMTGYSDIAQSGLARKMGHFIAQNGDMYAAEATWGALVARGMFGMRTEEQLVTSRQSYDQKRYQKSLDDDAYEYFTRIENITKSLRNKGDVRGEWLDRVAMENLILNNCRDKEECFYIINKYESLTANSSGTKDGLDTMIAEAVYQGMPVLDSAKAAINSLNSVSPDEKTQLHRLLDENTKSFGEAFPQYAEAIRNELALAKESQNAD